MYRDQRKLLGFLPYYFLSYSLQTRFLTSPRARLVKINRTYMVLFASSPKALEFRFTESYLAFYIGSGVQTQALILSYQTLFPLCHHPRAFLGVLKVKKIITNNQK